jgi:hypothetical protein
MDAMKKKITEVAAKGAALAEEKGRALANSIADEAKKQAAYRTKQLKAAASGNSAAAGSAVKGGGGANEKSERSTKKRKQSVAISQGTYFSLALSLSLSLSVFIFSNSLPVHLL